MRKKLLYISMAALMLGLCLAGVASAAGNYVIDEANLFTETEETMLRGKIDSFIAQYNTDFVILTIDDDMDKTSMTYADDYYDNNGYGKGEDRSGLLVLINMDEREVWISTTGYMIDILNDRRIEIMLDDIYEYLVEGEFYEAVSGLPEVVGDYIEAGRVKGQYQAPAWQTGRINALSSGWIALTVVLGAAAVFVVYFFTNGYNKRQRQKITAPVNFGFDSIYLGKEASYSTLKSTENYDIQTDVKRTRTYDPVVVHHVVSNSFFGPSYTSRTSPSSGASSGGNSRSSSGSFSSSATRSTTHKSSSGTKHGGGGKSF